MPLGRPSRAAVAEAISVAAAAPAAGVETEASSRPGIAAAGPDVKPTTQPARRGHRRVERRIEVLGDVARANPCTPSPAGPAAAWR